MTVGKLLKLSKIRDVVGLSMSIRLEVVYERTQLTERQKRTTESGSKCAVSVS